MAKYVETNPGEKTSHSSARGKPAKSSSKVPSNKPTKDERLSVKQKQPLVTISSKASILSPIGKNKKVIKN